MAHSRSGDQESCCRGLLAVYESVLGVPYGAPVIADAQHDRPRPGYFAPCERGPGRAVEHARFFLTSEQARVEAEWARRVDPSAGSRLGNP